MWCVYIYNQLGKRNTKPPPGDGFFHPFLFKKPWRVFFSGLLRQVNQLGRVGFNIQLRIHGDHQAWKVRGSVFGFLLCRWDCKHVDIFWESSMAASLGVYSILLSILSHLGIVCGIGFATLEKTCQEGTQIAAVGSSEWQVWDMENPPFTDHFLVRRR